MDRTNYSLLSIVGIVALTAIIAMVTHASNIPATEYGPRIMLVDGSSSSPASDAGSSGAVLTGRVVDSGAAPSVTPERARPEFDWTKYDYDSDGILSELDSVVLADVTDRTRFCPTGKICDVDSSGLVDLRDLGLFNAKVLEQAMQRRIETAFLTGNVVAGNDAPTRDGATGDNRVALYAGATGVPFQ